MTSFKNICNTMAILPLLFFNCKNEPKQISIYSEIATDKHEAVLEYNTKAQLGEGAFWNHKTQELYWVDIEGKKLHIYNPSEKT
ncbi:MAG: SMP-30/gluconolactonase/LRE family protein, partial [Flavobacteriaceae bacterium]|nr:SMP-30/gluconolactonase/LRE family protein [Flavobacteriaceae bacterium]